MIGTPQIAGMVFFVMEPVGLQFEKIDHVLGQIITLTVKIANSKYELPVVNLLHVIQE